MALCLDDPVQFVRGVGPARAMVFERLGVRLVRDLLEYFPFRHELIPKSVPIGALELDTTATVVGEVTRAKTRGGQRDQLLTATVADATGTCQVRWFNSPYLGDKIGPGAIVRLTGKVSAYRNQPSLTNPQTTIIEAAEDPLACDRDRFEPVYPATAELPSRQIARVVGLALDLAGDQLGDFLPDALRATRRLPPRRTAILRYHRPTAPDDVAVARRRLAYDELLLCQLAVQLGRRAQRKAPPAKPIETTEKIDQRIRRRFPFALTAGQDHAVAEIRADLARTQPMNRLLQGDVGAGKTAVAVYAALSTIANRCQVALLAPTEVLARQHQAKIERYLRGSRVKTAFLAGSTSRADRRALLGELPAGRCDWVIGTHAILENDVQFHDLGLVLIDEQHKFGVAQRAALRRKGESPHCLVLTATPIPRTLAMTVFGDLDVSTIHGVLPGRQPVVTRLVPPDKTEQAWSFVRAHLQRGEQAYVVYPLIEESDRTALKDATSEARRLERTTLAGFRVGLLHGRMSAADKADTMARFRAGDIQVLAATTVIEVGIDVPNATMILIQHAERYGLSQLHQMRGRVGRSAKKSFCLLFSEAENAASMERLRVLCESTDGFRIAEEDLRLRGPGELVGTRQHGVPAFRVANLVTDLDLLTTARDDAAELLAADEHLARPEHRALRQELIRHYGDTWQLVDVA